VVNLEHATVAAAQASTTRLARELQDDTLVDLVRPGGLAHLADVIRDSTEASALTPASHAAAASDFQARVRESRQVAAAELNVRLEDAYLEQAARDHMRDGVGSRQQAIAKRFVSRNIEQVESINAAKELVRIRAVAKQVILESLAKQ
jgi:hypothetical protein